MAPRHSFAPEDSFPSTSGRPDVVQRLPSREGFAFNLSPSKEDPLARRAAEHVFGSQVVAECFSSLHRSSLSYEALLDDLMEYNRPHAKARRDDPIYQMVFQSLREDLRCKTKLIPYTIGAVTKLSEFPRAKSPGLPWKNQGYRTKGEVVDNPENVHAINVYWQHVGAGISHSHPPDTCLFARSQVCDVNKEKIRGVWGYPLVMYMEEARFFYPVMDYLKGHEHKFPIAYGLEIGNGGMVALSDMVIRHPNSKSLMTDWSKFDKSIPPWMIRDAFALLAELIDFDQVRDSEGLVWSVRGYRSKRRWKKLVDYFVETPVRTCKGERFLVRAGVPSGSCFTNVIDTIINCIVTRYCLYATTGHFPVGEMYLGDDGVIVTVGNSVVNLDVIADVARVNFGLHLSREKSYVTSNPENVHFLGYHNYPVGMPNRDQKLLIVSFVHPEHTRRSAEEAGAAALGQLWANFDPQLARKWYEVLMYVNAEFNLKNEDVLVQLRRHAHRHKYLSHIGRNVQTLTVPYPDEFGNILEVLPKPVPLILPPSREYDYWRLHNDAFLFWNEGYEDVD